MTTKHMLKGWPLIAAALLLSAWIAPAAAQDDDEDLGELLQDMGQFYAEGYLAPFISGFGINQNAGLYHTADIPKVGLQLSFGLKAMAAELGDDDRTFSVSRQVDLSDYLDPGDPGYGETGVLVASGPTAFGSEEDGSLTAYWHGLPVYSESMPGGNIDLDYIPLVAPEFSLGGMGGFRVTMRGVPMEIDIENFGKLKYLGFGLAYSVNSLVPTLPVDVMVGGFTQNLDITYDNGDEASFSASAKSYYAAVSKTFSMLTVYGGVAKEESSMDVAYMYVGDEFDTSDDEEIAFSLDGVQEKRTTLGATLNLGVKVNAEMSMGNMTSYAGGIVLGF